MTTRKNTKLRKLKRNNNYKSKSKKNMKIVRNMKMKGGAEQIGGFVNMTCYLYDFDDSIKNTIDVILPHILEYVDYLGTSKSILCRWKRGITHLQQGKQTYFIDTDNVKTFYDLFIIGPIKFWPYYIFLSIVI